MMKKLSFIIPLLLCLMSFDAAAQWYLFDITPEEKKDSTKAKAADTYRDGHLNLGLMLPLRSKTDKPNSNFLDLYSGALMAVREIADSTGLEIDLKVSDTTDPDTPVSDLAVNSCDINIGPISVNDIREALAVCNSDRYIVSPLDPKAADLLMDGNLIQTPSSWQSLIDEMILWLREETAPSHEVVVLMDNSEAGKGEQTNYLLNSLRWSGIRYVTVEALNEDAFSNKKDYKIIIASDSDGFITPNLKNIAALATKFPNITLFCTSRIRSSSGMNLNDLYYANARLTAPYHIDYNDPAVKDFILKYRALFQTEPSSFSFQGYDTVHFFGFLFWKYGKDWAERLSDYSEDGLQSGFRFTSGSRYNTAVRRVIYNRNLTTTLQK